MTPANSPCRDGQGFVSHDFLGDKCIKCGMIASQVGGRLARRCPHSTTMTTCADCLLGECIRLELLVIRKTEALIMCRDGYDWDRHRAAWLNKEIDADEPHD